MTEKEKELVGWYLRFCNIADAYDRRANKIKKELALLAPHKKGEIANWNEVVAQNKGSHYEVTNRGKVTAVCVNVEVDILETVDDGTADIVYMYECRAIKKYGGLDFKILYAPNNVEWTGEMYNLND